MSQLSKYTTVKTLGQGSYGKALLVRSRNGTMYVMKEIQIGHLSNKEKEASVAEATVLSKMHHSNICAYVESFLNQPRNDVLYIVMDYADGGDLSSAVERRKKTKRPFSESEVMNVFVQICLALKHVHAQKILHRDLKSQNIFLTKKGVVKLGDFGIAKVLDSTGDVAKTQIGTPYYLSPEICEDKPYGKKSDIWSLGCVLYEIAALTLPFQARNLPALAHRIMTKTPQPLPASHRYSSNLQRLVSSLLNKRPENRPSIINILRSEYVQNHIQQLLSHTIKSGTGGMEGDARSNNNVNTGNNNSKNKVNAKPFTPKLPEKRDAVSNNERRASAMEKFKKEKAEEDAAAKRNDEKRALAMERFRKENAEADVIRRRNEARDKEKEDRAAIERANARAAEQKKKLEVLRQEKQDALREHAKMEEKLRKERELRVKEREREAKRKLRADMEKRKREEYEEQQLLKFRQQQREIQEAAMEGGMAVAERKRSPSKPVSLHEWVKNKNGGEPRADFQVRSEFDAEAKGGVDLSFDRGGGGDENVGYDGRDGWMYREQSALEQDIEEAKRVYEEKVKARNRLDNAREAEQVRQRHREYVQNNVSGYGGGNGYGGGGGGGVWEAKREEASSYRQSHNQVQQRRQHSNYNGGQFSNPATEWGWSRAQAERNRIRAENDLGCGQGQKANIKPDANTNALSNMKAMRNEIDAIDALSERDRAAHRQQQAREEYFQNRQIAAAAKARYHHEDQNFGTPDASARGEDVRGRRSSINEVRQSANLQKEIEDARKKAEFDDAYKMMQAERANLAEKLRMRNEEINHVIEEDLVSEQKEAGGVEEAKVVEEDDMAPYSAEVNELARNLEQATAADDDIDDEDDDDDDDLVVEGGHNTLLGGGMSIHTAIEAVEGNDEEDGGSADNYFSSDDDIVFTPSKRKIRSKSKEERNGIMISPVKMREEGKECERDDDDEGKEEEKDGSVEEEIAFTPGDDDGEQVMDELVRTLHRMNSGEVVLDSEEGVDELLIGGDEGHFMPKKLREGERKTNRKPSRDALPRPTQSSEPQMPMSPPPPQMFSSPSGVALSIDMSDMR